MFAFAFTHVVPRGAGEIVLDETAPTISATSWDDTARIASFTIDEGATVHWAHYSGAQPTFDGTSWTGATEATSSQGFPAGARSLDLMLDLANTGTGLVYYARDPSGNLSTAVAETITAPDVPDAFTNSDYSVADVGDGTFNLTISSLPTSDPAITDVEVDTGSGFLSLGATSGTINIATGEGQFTVQLRGINVRGTGGASSGLVVDVTVPAGPTVPEAFTSGNLGVTDGVADRFSITLGTFPADGGSAITDAEYSTDAGTTWRSLGVTTPQTIEVTVDSLGVPVTVGTYNVLVRAVNAQGAGPSTNAGTAEVEAAPTAPDQFSNADFSLTDGEADRFTINITGLPASGGATITSLEYSTDGTNWRALASASPASEVVTVDSTGTALTVGAYNVQIRAVNGIGAGAASAAESVNVTAPDTAPDAMQTSDFTVTDNQDGRIALDLLSLPADGGSAITSVQYQLNGGAFTDLPSYAGTGQYLISSGDGSFDVALRAVNAIGNGGASGVLSVTVTTVVAFVVSEQGGQLDVLPDADGPDNVEYVISGNPDYNGTYNISRAALALAPVNALPAVIAYTDANETELTRTPGLWFTDDPASATLAIQWQADGVDIPNANTPNLILTSAEDGATITVVETVTDANGTTAQASNGVGGGSSETELFVETFTEPDLTRPRDLASLTLLTQGSGSGTGVDIIGGIVDHTAGFEILQMRSPALAEGSYCQIEIIDLPNDGSQIDLYLHAAEQTAAGAVTDAMRLRFTHQSIDFELLRTGGNEAFAAIAAPLVDTGGGAIVARLRFSGGDFIGSIDGTDIGSVTPANSLTGRYANYGASGDIQYDNISAGNL